MRHINKIVLWCNAHGNAHRLVNMLVRRVAFARSMGVCMMAMCCTGCFGTHSTVEPPDVGIPNVGNSCCVNAPMQIILRLYPDSFERSDVRRHGQVLYNKLRHDGGHVTQGEAQAFYSAVVDAGANWNIEAGSQQDARECLEAMDGQLQGALPPCRFYQRIVARDDPHRVFVDWRAMNETRLFAAIPPSLGGVCAMETILQCYFGDQPIPYRPRGPESPQVNSLRQWRVALDDSDERPLPIFVRRFGLDKQGNHIKNRTDITNALAFTLPATSQHDGVRDARYTLVGFVVHNGTTLKGGHYMAYVLQDGQWRYYDDGTVRCVDVNSAEIASQQGCLFFYRRSAETPGANDAAQPDDSRATKRRLLADAAEAREGARGEHDAAG